MNEQSASQNLTETVFKGKRLTLVPIGDSHYGASFCNVPYFEGHIRWAESRNDVFVVGMGDWMECATRLSKGDIYSQIKPQEQLKYLYRQFYWLAKRGRLIGLRAGNHENRIYHETGTDPAETLALWLGVPYLGATSFHRIWVNNQLYVIASRHGASGAATLEGKIRSIRNFAKTHSADIYIEGHTHHAFAVPEDILVQGEQGMEYGRRWFVNSGHFADYVGSYAAEKGYEIGRRGTVKIKLYGDKRDVHCGS